MNQKYNLVELFSGIGSQAKALNNIGMQFNTIGTCEWDIHAFIAYDAIHNSTQNLPEIENMSKDEILENIASYTLSNNGKEAMQYDILKTYSEKVLKRIYSAIVRCNNFVDVNALTGEALPDNIDILTYSFPCQDLSNVGAFHGYNKGIDKNSGSRSSLLWQVGRILTEMRSEGKDLPRFLLMENVPALLSKRHFENFSAWINDLHNLGYESKYFQLNASDFGLPQNRPRLLMISVQVGDNKEYQEAVNSYFNYINESSIVLDYAQSEFYERKEIKDLLRINYNNLKIRNEAIACTPNDTASRRKIWEENPQIIREDDKLNGDFAVIRTITTKQDRNPNSGNLYFDSGIEGKSKFRYLTPRECLLFMGFADEDYRHIVSENPEIHKGSLLFPRDKIIRMAGNSIPVKLLEGVFLQIKYLEELSMVINMDEHDRATRSYNMSPIKRKNTNPEDIVCKYLFSRGFRYRKNGKTLPGTPNIVLKKYKIAIFIKGCFWHGHEGCKFFAVPKTHTQFWVEKINCNKDHDKADESKLRAMGWTVITLWECELTPKSKEKTLEHLLLRIKASEVNNVELHEGCL